MRPHQTRSAAYLATAAGAFLLATTALSPPVLANPESGSVVGGSAAINRSGDTLKVKQDSKRAAIEWKTFDIAKGETTRFVQPSKQAAALNRVTGGDASKIMGNLQANGRLFLINPAGMVFGQNARVDVGALVASTSDMATDEFMDGSNRLDKPGQAGAGIVNRGTIAAREGGMVGLLAPRTLNQGTIRARLGHVELASGDTATVDFHGDGLMQVAVKDEDIKQQLVANSGKLSAAGGTVEMTAGQARSIVDSLISAEGELEAPTVEQKDGAIIIRDKGSHASEADDSNRHVHVGGYLNASGRDDGEQGGTIDILGPHIALSGGALLDANGHSAPKPPPKPASRPSLRGSSDAADEAISSHNDGTATMTADGEVRGENKFLAHDNRAGGSIKVGGDYLGRGDTQTAESLYVGPTTLVLNDAIDSGDAGRTIFWSDNITEYHGTTLARGGTQGGHGGFVETSGKQTLIPRGRAILTPRATGFDKGTYLLDPENITILGNVDPEFVSTDSTIDFSNNLQLWLDGSDASTITASSGRVTEWADKSGNGFNATASGSLRPETGNNSLNGKNVIFFGSGQGMEIDDALNIDSPPYTFFTLFNRNSGTGLGRAIQGRDNNWLVGPWKNNVAHFAEGCVSGVQCSGTDTPLTLGQHYITSAVNDGSQSAFFADSNDITTNSSNTGVPGRLGLGVVGQFSEATQGNIPEVIVYDKDFSDSKRNLIEQYQSAKWDIELNPPGSGADEAAKAMASDGFSNFTVSYLERLSNNADIDLQASDSITLDLQGDTLNIQDNNSISLTTTGSNAAITDDSSGTIKTKRGSNGPGNITIDATGDVALVQTTLDAQNGGDITVTANGNINLETTALSTDDLGTATKTQVENAERVDLPSTYEYSRERAGERVPETLLNDSGAAQGVTAATSSADTDTSTGTGNTGGDNAPEGQQPGTTRTAAVEAREDEADIPALNLRITDAVKKRYNLTKQRLKTLGLR